MIAPPCSLTYIFSTEKGLRMMYCARRSRSSRWRGWMRRGWAAWPVPAAVRAQRPVDATVLRAAPAGVGAGRDTGPAGGHPGDDTRILARRTAGRLPAPPLLCVGGLRQRAQLGDLVDELNMGDFAQPRGNPRIDDHRHFEISGRKCARKSATTWRHLGRRAV